MAFIALCFLLSCIPLTSLSSASAAPMIIESHGGNGALTSLNWAGYAVSESGGITSVSGSWVEPTVTCGKSQTAYAAFWVGIDGFTSTTVEQTGTDSDCSGGSPQYYAWYEFYPKASKTIASLTVSPGDVIDASVVYNSGTTFTVSITDQTTGKSFSTAGSVSKAARSSAEFIAESPEICQAGKCKLAKLSDFGTVGFGPDNTGTSSYPCTVGLSGSVANLGTYGSAIQEITMATKSGAVRALPSAISSDGTSFTVQWEHR